MQKKGFLSKILENSIKVHSLFFFLIFSIIIKLINLAYSKSIHEVLMDLFKLKSFFHAFPDVQKGRDHFIDTKLNPVITLKSQNFRKKKKKRKIFSRLSEIP